MDESSVRSAGWSNRLLRWLLGAVFVVSAPNHYLQLMPDPPMPIAAVAFHHALTSSGYVFQLVVSVESVAGLLLLLGVAVPFALVLLAPIIINIFCFHLFLAPGGLPVAAALAGAELILALQYRTSFRPLFSADAVATSPAYQEHSA